MHSIFLATGPPGPGVKKAGRGILVGIKQPASTSTASCNQNLAAWLGRSLQLYSTLVSSPNGAASSPELLTLVVKTVGIGNTEVSI